MSRDLKAALRFLRAASTCLTQSAQADTLDARTRELVLHQVLAVDAEANTVARRLVDEAEHRAALRRTRKATP